MELATLGIAVFYGLGSLIIRSMGNKHIKSLVWLGFPAILLGIYNSCHHSFSATK